MNQILKIIVVLFSLNPYLSTDLYCQDQKQSNENNWFKKNWIPPDYAYFHIGIGRGLSIAGSSDIERAINPFEMYPVSFDKYFNLFVGYKSIFQIEYRNNKSNHNFHDTDPALQGGQVVREGTEIEMELDFNEWLFKFNPFFKVTTPPWAIFLVYGIGDVDIIDNNGDGFKGGSESIFGLDVNYTMKYFSAGAALEFRSLSFEKFELQDFDTLNQDFEMGYFIIGINIGIGWGI